MATHTQVIPDCPRCGKEMEIVSTRGKRTPEYPIYGTPTYWYECLNCGMRTPACEERDEALQTALDFVKKDPPAEVEA